MVEPLIAGWVGLILQVAINCASLVMGPTPSGVHSISAGTQFPEYGNFGLSWHVT